MNWSKGRYAKGRGSSPKNSMDYVRHDKKARAHERVGEYELRNMGGDLSTAAGQMQATIDAAKAMQKRQRQMEGKREQSSGSRIEKPIFHYVLSWHPDDRPDRKQMMDAAGQTLRLLKLHEHEAVIVEHTDRSHKHVHIVVNLVHPETGRMANLYRDEKKLDRWAHDYEVAHMKIRSFQRAAKHERAHEINPAADKKAKLIIRLSEKEWDTLRERHSKSDERRHSESFNLALTHQKQMQDTWHKYEVLIEDRKIRRPKTPELAHRPKHLPHFRSPSFNGLEKMPQFRRRVKGAFIRATQMTKPEKERSPLAVKFHVKVQGRDYSLPIKHTPEMRRMARTKRIEDLRAAREVEITAIKARHKSQREQMRQTHAKERSVEKVERALLGQNIERAWREWRKEFNRPDPRRDRDERERREDKRTLGLDKKIDRPAREFDKTEKERTGLEPKQEFGRVAKDTPDLTHEFAQAAKDRPDLSHEFTQAAKDRPDLSHEFSEASRDTPDLTRQFTEVNRDRER